MPFHLNRFFEIPQFKAGVLSPELKRALGMKEGSLYCYLTLITGDIPPYFERMKRYVIVNFHTCKDTDCHRFCIKLIQALLFLSRITLIHL